MGHYDLYTGLSVRDYFNIFIALYVLQTLSVFIVKYVVVKDFRKINIIKQFAHALENCGIVFPVKDWDAEVGTIEDHKKRMKKVNKEMLLTMTVNFLFNFLML